LTCFWLRKTPIADLPPIGFCIHPLLGSKMMAEACCLAKTVALIRRLAVKFAPDYYVLCEIEILG
jgi:hypothetical protein